MIGGVATFTHANRWQEELAGVSSAPVGTASDPTSVQYVTAISNCRTIERQRQEGTRLPSVMPFCPGPFSGWVTDNRALNLRFNSGRTFWWLQSLQCSFSLPEGAARDYTETP